MAPGETPSLTGESIGEAHRVLERTQTHPYGNQHTNPPTWESAPERCNSLVGSGGSD